MRLAFAVIVFAASLLTVIPAPSYTLWKASVAVTEWGDYLAIIAALTFLPGWRRSRAARIAAVVAAAAVVLSLSPLMQAVPLAGAVRAVMAEMQPGSMPGAPPLSRPLSLTGLFTKPASPQVTMSTAAYVTRNGKPIQLDIYRRDGVRAPEPLVMIIHGGSWSGGSRDELSELNPYLAARGYVVASPDYRLAPAFRHPAQTDDINAAIDYLKANAAALGIDARRIVLIGRSAGGQLALLSAYSRNDSSIRGAVSFYGPTDQKWGWDNPTNPNVYDSFRTLRSFLGGSPADNPEGYRNSSPMTYGGMHAVPTLLIHGDLDPLVSVRQSARLDSALSDTRVPHMFIRMPWATHGCDYVFNGPCGQISTYAIERFLAIVTGSRRQKPEARTI